MILGYFVEQKDGLYKAFRHNGTIQAREFLWWNSHVRNSLLLPISSKGRDLVEKNKAKITSKFCFDVK